HHAQRITHNASRTTHHGPMSDTLSKSAPGFLFRTALPCDLESVRPAALAACEALAGHGAGQEKLLACELALVEACNNAILYASAAGRQKPIEIQLLAEGAALEMQVIDHTRG